MPNVTLPKTAPIRMLKETLVRVAKDGLIDGMSKYDEAQNLINTFQRAVDSLDSVPQLNTLMQKVDASLAPLAYSGMTGRLKPDGSTWEPRAEFMMLLHSIRDTAALEIPGRLELRHRAEQAENIIRRQFP